MLYFFDYLHLLLAYVFLLNTLDSETLTPEATFMAFDNSTSFNLSINFQAIYIN